MKKLIKNRKGVIGLEYARAVLLGLLIISVLAIVLFLIVSNLRDTVESTEALTSKTVRNESIGTVNDAAYSDFDARTDSDKRNPTCTLINCNNATASTVIPSTNYTQNNCRITFSSAGTNSIWNNTNWNCSYTVTYVSPQVNWIASNITVGPQNFFKQMPTIFTLLGVVLIILVITIVIVAISKFSGGGGSVGFGGGAGRELDEL